MLIVSVWIYDYWDKFYRSTFAALDPMLTFFSQYQTTIVV